MRSPRLWKAGNDAAMLLRTSHDLQDLGITVRSASSFPASLVVEFTSDRGEIRVAVERPDWPDLSPDFLADDARRQLLGEWERRGPKPEAGTVVP